MQPDRHRPERFGEITEFIQSSRNQAILSVNAKFTHLNWKIGKRLRQEVIPTTSFFDEE